MKKLTMIILSIFLVLSIGQVTFANPNINLAVGYSKFYGSPAIAFDVSGGYRFNNWFSLEGDLLFSFSKQSDASDKSFGRSFGIDADILAKFDLYCYSKLNFGLQIGIKDIYLNYASFNYSK